MREEAEPCPTSPNLGEAAARSSKVLVPQCHLLVPNCHLLVPKVPRAGPAAFVPLLKERSGAFGARRASRDVTGMGEAHRERAAAAPFKVAIEAPLLQGREQGQAKGGTLKEAKK